MSLFNQSNACLELRDGDQAEILSRRLEQYEQTLRVMYQRLTETCSRQEAIRHEVQQLMNGLRQLLVRLESLDCDNNEENEYDTNITGSNDGFSSVEQRQNGFKKFLHVGNEEIHSRGHVEFQST